MFASISATGAAASEAQLGVALGLWTLIPFAALLLAIAVLPLVAHHWWESNRNRAIVSAVCAAPVAAYLLVAHGDVGLHVVLEKLHEYVAFIALLAALYVISGGIYIGGSLSGTPLVNTMVMALGAIAANVIGTTGASVVLIRPLLRANASRQRRAHVVVFFIFIVSNCGGLLTPIGDPPLFLGYLKGVPFEWTLRFWREWAVAVGALLVVFHLWDQIVLSREEIARPGAQLEDVQRHEPLTLRGGFNVVLLLAVVAVVIASGAGIGNGGRPWSFGIQEGLLLALAGLGYATTAKRNRELNRFSFGPIVEVAVLFAGIFVAMGPALAILNAWSQGQRDVLGVAFALSEPAQFFWATGTLSSFLDNAPTYLAFAATAAGVEGIPLEGPFLGQLIARPHGAALLEAISCGAVLMGAMTYIGNGPNFMVKAIAEENGVRMPSFFAYLAYAACVLLPIFGAVTWLFFR